MSETWYLHGSGRKTRQQWAELQEHARACTASWADHLGFHQEGLPAELPATTHLWAWADRWWLRVRIDHDHWWAALLTEGDSVQLWENPAPIDPPTITDFRNWGENEREVRQYQGAPGVRGRDDMLQLVPLRQTTAIFIGDTATTATRS